MKVLWVTKNTKIWYPIGVTRRGILELIIGLARRNNKMRM